MEKFASSPNVEQRREVPALDFKNLPLTEVVCRFTLGKPLPVGLPFLFDLFVSLQSQFPEIGDLAAFEPAPGQQASLTVKEGGAPLGARFLGENGIEAYVQPQLIGVRWRGWDGAQEPTGFPYPRFVTGMRPALEALCGAIAGLIGPEEVRPSVANMYYVNFIEAGAPLRSQKLLQYTTVVDSPVLPDAERLHAHEVLYRGSREVDLRISVVATEPLKGQMGKSGFVLTTSAGKFGDPSNANIDAGLDLLQDVHDELLIMFESILTDRAVEEWKRV